MTYQNTDTQPTIEELDLWTNQTRDWFTTHSRKLISKGLKADLRERGAKWCPRCRQVRLIEDFGKNASKADGLQGNCRACFNGGHRERYRRDPERREYLLEYHSTRYATDEMFRLRAQLDSGYRRAVRAGVQADWIQPEHLLAFWAAKGIPALECIYTGSELTPQDRSIDHATPISRGGAHTVENLVPASYEANERKQSKTAVEFVIGRSEESDLDDFDSLPEDVKRAFSPSAPIRKKRIVDLNPEALEN